MAYEVDPVSIATRGYVCNEEPDDIAIATRGYVCDTGAVAPAVRNATVRMWTGNMEIDLYGRYDRG
jgi:hypothetical protein